VLVPQARLERLAVITSDPKIAAYGAEVRW
jgi:hypothetical protein